MSNPGDTVWIDSWITYEGRNHPSMPRRHKATVIDTASSKVLFVTPDAYPTEERARTVAAAWVQEQAFICVGSSPKASSRHGKRRGRP